MAAAAAAAGAGAAVASVAATDAKAPAKKVVDLRSDTVTQPTPAMRKAMSEAEVGDDVMGDDPSVNALQQAVAKTLGKECGLFVPSGTMGNLIACLVWCDARDSEMIVGDQSHIHLYEQGSSATLGGIHTRTVRTQPDGTLPLADITALLRGANAADDPHLPLTKLVCLENTHNRMYGTPLTAEYTNSVGALCRANGLKLHLDGARLFNAQQALGVPAAQLCAAADSVTVCLSKGLASPVGSVLCGSAAFVAKARRLRKALGGGMRQAGVLAACGLVSLNDMVERLSDDHARAKALAKGLNGLPGLSVDVDARVHTNIVFVSVDAKALGGTDADTLKGLLKAQGVLNGAYPGNVLRFVLHYHITDADVAHVVATVKAVVTPLAAAAAAK